VEVRREREECLWRSLPPRKLIYGRRKTGKTYFVRNYTEWDHYYTVSRDGVVYDEELNELNYDVFYERIRHQTNKKVVIDEFHRLPPKFLTFLQHSSPNWTLVTSTLFLAKKLLSSSSPILGLFQPLRFDIIDPADILRALGSRFSGPELIENAVYLREPLLLNFPLSEPLERRLSLAVPVASALVGEIFLEERREYSRGYHSVLRSIAGGYTRPQKAARFLQGKSFYIHILREMGLIKAVRVHGQKRYLYRHSSPLLDLYYYLSAKYLYEETGTFKKEALRTLLPIHVEWFVEELLSEIHSLEPVKVLNPELDVALARGKRVAVVAEVKWTDSLSSTELRKIEEKLAPFRAKKYLVVKDKSGIASTKLNVLDASDLLALAREHRHC